MGPRCGISSLAAVFFGHSLKRLKIIDPVSLLCYITRIFAI